MVRKQFQKKISINFCILIYSSRRKRLFYDFHQKLEILGLGRGQKIWKKHSRMKKTKQSRIWNIIGSAVMCNFNHKHECYYNITQASLYSSPLGKLPCRRFVWKSKIYYTLEILPRIYNIKNRFYQFFSK